MPEPKWSPLKANLFAAGLLLALWTIIILLGLLVWGFFSGRI